MIALKRRTVGKVLATQVQDPSLVSKPQVEKIGQASHGDTCM